YHCHAHPHSLHPFPTRRSSDLADAARNWPAGYPERAGVVRSQRRRLTTKQVFGLMLQAVLGPRYGLEPGRLDRLAVGGTPAIGTDRKSTRLNSSHVKISYAVFC